MIILKILILLFCLFATVHASDHNTAETCTESNLDAAGGPLEHWSFISQGNEGNCYAHSAAAILYARLGGKNLPSGFMLSIDTELAARKGMREWLEEYDEKAETLRKLEKKPIPEDGTEQTELKKEIKELKKYIEEERDYQEAATLQINAGLFQMGRSVSDAIEQFIENGACHSNMVDPSGVDSDLIQKLQGTKIIYRSQAHLLEGEKLIEYKKKVASGVICHLGERGIHEDIHPIAETIISALAAADEMLFAETVLSEVSKACTDARRIRPPRGFEPPVTEYPLTNKAFAKILNQQLTKSQPLTVSFCAELLPQGPSYRGLDKSSMSSSDELESATCASDDGHVAVALGRRFNPKTHKCEVKLWNPNDLNCTSTSRKFECTKGKGIVYVELDALGSNLIETTKLP